MANNIGLHCRFCTEQVLKWILNNKIIAFLILLSFSLFVSTLTLAAQKNSAWDEYDSLTGDCHLALRKDFGRPSPVFLRGGTFLSPDSSGAITLQRSETIVIACPERRVKLVNQTTSYDVLEAHCIINDTFRLDRWIGRFQDISCSSQPWVSTEEVRAGCGRGYQLHRVGYKVGRTFHALYEACFNPDEVQTIYVKHQLTPSRLHFQPDGNRPQFFEGDLFKSVSMADIYKVKNQDERIRLIAGDNAGNYISKNEYLTRGHLAARADFSFRAEQRASFHYVNSAPQWRTANAGAWAALEDSLRRRVHDAGRTVDVYTGPLGISTLADHSFWMTVDSNNNGLVPVPMYFYKLVYDPESGTAVAFISINNSALNATAAVDKVICHSVCNRYSWLTWKGDGNSCCNYHDIKDIARLPKMKVNGLLDL